MQRDTEMPSPVTNQCWQDFGLVHTAGVGVGLLATAASLGLEINR